MRRSTHLVLLWFITFALAACSKVPLAPIQTSPRAAESQTMLPTAIPPEVFPGGWAISFKYPFPENFWNVGIHRYRFYIDCPLLNQEIYKGETRRFIVSEEMPVYEEPIYLRLGGLSYGPLAPLSTITVNPMQGTIAIVTFSGVTEEDTKLATTSTNCTVSMNWDGVSTVILIPGEPFQP